MKSNKKWTKTNGHTLGEVYKAITGRPIDNAHNSLEDAKAQLTIILHPEFQKFIDLLYCPIHSLSNLLDVAAQHTCHLMHARLCGQPWRYRSLPYLTSVVPTCPIVEIRRSHCDATDQWCCHIHRTTMWRRRSDNKKLF